MTPWALLAVLLSVPVTAAGVPAGSRAVVVDPVGNQTSVQATGSSSNSIVDGPSLVDQTLEEGGTSLDITTDERMPFSGYKQVSASQLGPGGSTGNDITSTSQYSTNADEKNSHDVFAPHQQSSSNSGFEFEGTPLTSTFSPPHSSSVAFGVVQSTPSGQIESTQESVGLSNTPVDRFDRPVPSTDVYFNGDKSGKIESSQVDSYSNLKQASSDSNAWGQHYSGTEQSTSDVLESTTAYQVFSTESSASPSSSPVDWIAEPSDSEFEEMQGSTQQFADEESQTETSGSTSTFGGYRAQKSRFSHHTFSERPGPKSRLRGHYSGSRKSSEMFDGHHRPKSWSSSVEDTLTPESSSGSEEEISTPFGSSESTVRFMDSSDPISSESTPLPFGEPKLETVASSSIFEETISTLESSPGTVSVTMSNSVIGGVSPPLRTGQQNSGRKTTNSVTQSVQHVSGSQELRYSDAEHPMDSSQEEGTPTVAQPLSEGGDATVLTVFTTTPIQKHTKAAASSTSEAQSPVVGSKPLPRPDKKPSSFSLSSILRGLSSSKQFELESRSDEGLYNQNSSSSGSFASENQQPPGQGGQSSDIISDMNSAFPGMFSQISSSAPVSFSSAVRPTASVSQGVPPARSTSPGVSSGRASTVSESSKSQFVSRSEYESESAGFDEHTLNRDSTSTETTSTVQSTVPFGSVSSTSSEEATSLGTTQSPISTPVHGGFSTHRRSTTSSSGVGYSFADTSSSSAGSASASSSVSSRSLPPWIKPWPGFSEQESSSRSASSSAAGSTTMTSAPASTTSGGSSGIASSTASSESASSGTSAASSVESAFVSGSRSVSASGLNSGSSSASATSTSDEGLAGILRPHKTTSGASSSVSSSGVSSSAPASSAPVSSSATGSGSSSGALRSASVSRSSASVASASSASRSAGALSGSRTTSTSSSGRFERPVSSSAGVSSSGGFRLPVTSSSSQSVNIKTAQSSSSAPTPAPAASTSASSSAAPAQGSSAVTSSGIPVSSLPFASSQSSSAQGPSGSGALASSSSAAAAESSTRTGRVAIPTISSKSSVSLEDIFGSRTTTGSQPTGLSSGLSSGISGVSTSRGAVPTSTMGSAASSRSIPGASYVSQSIPNASSYRSTAPSPSSSSSRPVIGVVGSSSSSAGKASGVQPSSTGRPIRSTAAPSPSRSVGYSSSSVAGASSYRQTSQAKPSVTRAASSTVTATVQSSTSNWLPNGIITQQLSTATSASSASNSPTQTKSSKSKTATSIPSSMPRYIAPSGGIPKQPKDTTLIQIGFDYSLNYPFVVDHPLAVAQIFDYLPRGISYGLKTSESNISMTTLQPYQSSKAGYIVSVALAYIPKSLVDDLDAQIHNPRSRLYNNKDNSVAALMNLIDPSIPLTPGKGAVDTVSSNGPSNGNSGSSGNGSGSGSGDDNDDSGGKGNNAGSDSGSLDSKPSEKPKVNGKTVGIAIGSIAGAALYVGVIFIAHKQYKKRKIALEGSESDLDSNSNRFFDDGSVTGSSLSGSYSGSGTYTGSGSGSGGSRGLRSIISGTRSSNNNGVNNILPIGQHISEPVMSENSLGWT